MTKPYTERIELQHGTDRQYLIREFTDEVDVEELVWHRDRQHRKVHVLSSEGWKLQMEDRLPIPLEAGKEYFIGQNTYHRVIKGEGNLIVRIENI
jgi:hypothetical protein